MSLISDGELRRQLQNYGVDVGPIDGTTRNLYQKKLRSLSGKNPRHPGVKRRRSPVTPKQGHAAKRPREGNSPPNHVQAKKGSSIYPDLSEWLASSCKPNAGSQIIPGVHQARPPYSPLPHPANNRGGSNPIASSAQGATKSSTATGSNNYGGSKRIISGSQVIPGATKCSSSPTSNRGRSNPVASDCDATKHPAIPHSPTSHSANRGGSRHIASGSGMIPAAQVIPYSAHPPIPIRESSNPIPIPKSSNPPSAIKHKAMPSPSDSSNSLSPIGSNEEYSLSPPSPQVPSEIPRPGSSPELALSTPSPRKTGFLETVTKSVTNFIGSRVNQFFNKVEPRHSLQPSSHSPSGRHSGINPEPIHLAPVEEELDFEEDFEMAEATSSESSHEDNKYDWELKSSDVAICRRPDGAPWSLGKGGFGEVFKGLRDGVDEVAVKIIRISNCTPCVIAQFKAEIDLISKLRHRNVVQFYGACIHPQDLYMVTELMDNNLFSVLRLPREAEKYMWSGIYGRDILINVASGLNYLHSRKPPVVHRDIKSPNILVMEGVAKIADVGVARTMGGSAPDMTAQRGFTIAWAAPEVVYRRRATEKIDIWSLGVIMWEVVSGKLPRPGTLVLPAACPQLLKVLYSRCMSDDPLGRPSALEVVAKLKNIRE